MGMFLKELVPSGLSLEESIQRVKAQGGLICTPHPFDRLRASALDAKTMDEIADQIDIVEVFNARSLLRRAPNKARQFAQAHHLPGSAGSDAHTTVEIGNAYIEMPEFNSKEDFLKALAQGKVCGHLANPFSHFNSLWARLKKG
jgi:predicted metal-dependent phosphoesterase TrpH